MIRGVPDANDFLDHGVDYLNLGWGTVLQVLVDLAEAEEWTDGIEQEAKEEFWEAADREFATALSLVEQGAEFLLKARICGVSPWLLVTRNPSDWPRRCNTEDVDYSQFRTIDAQDLIKVHDTFSQTRLPAEFTTTFESLRRERNTIMHTIDKSLDLTAVSLIEKVLVVSEHLIGHQSWVSKRREFVERDRHAAIDVDYNDYRVAREFMTVAEPLPESQLRKHFGFTKRQRAYGCPRCCNANRDDELECMTALLRPNTPKSASVYCFICDKEAEIERIECADDDCKGNVIATDWGQCLSCLRRQ